MIRVVETRNLLEGLTELSGCWRELISWLKPRGLRGVRMFTGDKVAGMIGSIAEVFPDAAYQRCTVHFCRNVLARVPKSKRPRVVAMLKAIHPMGSREAFEAKALEMAAELGGMKLKDAAKVVREGCAETLAYTRFPRERRRRMRTDNAIERLNHEIRRRTRGRDASRREQRPHSRDREVEARRAGGAPAATWTSLCWTSDRTGGRA